MAGITNPVAGITNPVAGITNPVAGITNPVAGITNPVAGITNPVAGITNPVAGITNPTTLSIIYDLTESSNGQIVVDQLNENTGIETCRIDGVDSFSNAGNLAIRTGYNSQTLAYGTEGALQQFIPSTQDLEPIPDQF